MSYGATRFNKQIKPQSNLLEGLAVCWRFNESSGARLDAHGQNRLADNNTVGSAQGKFDYAANFVAANNEFLEIPDNPNVSAGDLPFTITAWIRLTSIGGDMTICSKWTVAGDNNCEYALGYDTTSFYFIVTNDGDAFSTFNGINASTPSPAVAGVWYFVMAKHDPLADLIYISVNDAAPDTKAFPGGIYDGTKSFEIGALQGANFMNGDIDLLTIHRRCLSANEITQMYNAGRGRDYPFLY